MNRLSIVTINWKMSSLVVLAHEKEMYSLYASLSRSLSVIANVTASPNVPEVVMKSTILFLGLSLILILAAVTAFSRRDLFD